MATFDDLLGEAGEFGVFQKMAFILVCIVTATFSYLYVGIVFLAFTPRHWCRSPGVSELRAKCGWSQEEEWNYTVPPADGGAPSHSHCLRYNVEWEWTPSGHCNIPLSFLPNASAQELPLALCQGEWVFEEGSYPSIVTEFGLVCTDAWKVDLSQACLNLGFMIGTVILGFVADRYGRKFCFLFSQFVSTVAGVAVALAPNYFWFLIFRTLQGIFGKGTWICPYVLISELVGMKHRRTVGIITQMCFSFGMMLLAAIAYLAPAWRTLQLLITVPNFIFMLYYWLLPESPRWLLSIKKQKKAIKVLQKMAKRNKKAFSVNIETVKIENSEEGLRKPTFVDLVRMAQIRKYTLILMYDWFVCALVYLGLVMRLGLIGGDIYLNFFISGLMEIPSAILILLLIDRVGRRWPFAAGYLLAGLACVVTAFVPDDVFWLKTVSASLGKLGITASFLMVCFVNTELYPTFLRNFAVSTCSAMCDFGGVIAPFILYRLMDVWTELPLVVFGVSALLAGGLIFYLPETKGTRLPETIEDAATLGRKKKASPQTSYQMVPPSAAGTSNEKEPASEVVI